MKPIEQRNSPGSMQALFASRHYRQPIMLTICWLSLMVPLHAARADFRHSIVAVNCSQHGEVSRVLERRTTNILRPIGLMLSGVGHVHLVIAYPGKLYLWQSIALAGISLAGGLLISLLFYNGVARRRAEALFHLKETELSEFRLQAQREREAIETELQESKERLTGIIASTMDAVIALDDKQQIVVFNPAAEKIFGCRSSEAVGSSIERFIPSRFHAVHRNHIQQFGKSTITRRPMGDGPAPLFGQRTDGSEFPIEASISHVITNRVNLFIVAIRDVTAHLQAETAARESEKRFRLMADSAPVLMWMAGTDGLWYDFNKEWLRFTGRTIQQEQGEGWMDGIHPNDLQASRRTQRQSFESRQPFSLEYRLRRHDGQYRWLLDNGVPRFREDGSFAGFIGCSIDITEQKEAKATQAELSGRLMQAHEEERQRIARELHDDINQRLALLANSIQEFEQIYTATGDYAQEKVQLTAFRQQITEIAADLQRLSHQLHPSKLHYLGLAAAVRGLCQEFSKLHRIKIDCVVRGLPSDLDENISLNLFRTAQESLHNVAKHSHAHFVKVELTAKDNEMRLRVSDDGIGFDYQQPENGQGLGLVSMRERLALLGGSFSIWSRPALGTQVEAVVPLRAKYARSA